jgi:putative CocE/NonD family hydrolase
MARLTIHRLLVLPTFALCLLQLSGQSGPRPGAKEEASAPSYDFRVEDGWLTMKDGVRLAATFYKPVPRSAGERFPVLFEFLPYRKDDGGYIGIYSLYTYFVRRGYILARVDIRGTGTSEGTFPLREYSEQELDDAVETIDQLSRLPASNGNVGMWGISWGGFNAIQVAMRRPPALKAILAAMATDDLYHDDIHYIDGAFHVDEWAFWFDHSKGIPRSPDYPIDEAYYRERFESYPGLLTYLKQQKDGEFWSRNSLRGQYAKIQVPCYLIGGLLDGYRDSIPRMLEEMKVPIKAEVGPWNHAWPDDGTPGPNYEWRCEAVRWWDQWLKGIETGVRSDPRLVIYLRDGHAPDAELAMTPGRWLAGDWPIPGTIRKKLFPAADRRLRDRPGATGGDALFYVPSYGISTGLWWGEPTGDMRPDDAGSLVYDSDVLREKFEIVGLPRVRLQVKADAPLAHWVARLEDVFPDGRVALVTGGLLNGSQRRSRLRPGPLVPGEFADLEFELHLTTWTFQPGHRVRLAVSNSLFPMIWPTPYLMTTTLVTGVETTCLELPMIPAGRFGVPAFRPAEKREVRTDARDLGSDVWPQGTNEWKRDPARGVVTYTWSGKSRYEIGDRRFEATEKNVYETNESDPANSRFVGEDSDRIELRGRTIDVLTSVEIRSDAGNFHIKFIRRILENSRLLRERQWQETIPRVFQ